MSTPAAIYASIQRYKRALMSQEAQASKRLATAYGRIYENLTNKIAQLEAEIGALGDNPQPWKVVQLDRYQQLLRQTSDEMDTFAGALEGEVATLRQRAIAAAEIQSQQLVQMALPREATRLMANFNRLPKEAVQAMLGSLSQGSPLAKLLDEYGRRAAQEIGDTITQGVALGYNPRKVATQIKGALGGNLTRALATARTEMLRSYRVATLESYKANPNIVKGWIWTAAKSPRTCLACLALDGREFSLDEPFFKAHVNCRCAPRPKTITYQDLGLKTKMPSSEYQTAGDWFNAQPDSVKRGMMSGQAYEAYKGGRVTLQDFIGEAHSEVWGDSFIEKPISSILGSMVPPLTPVPPSVVRESIASLPQAIEIIKMQGLGAPPKHIDQYLKEKGIDYVYGYHATSIEGSDRIKESGIRFSYQENRPDAAYFFLDKVDITDNANILGHHAEYAIVTVRIPASEAANIREDAFFNGTFPTSYSAARLLRKIPPEWIIRIERAGKSRN